MVMERDPLPTASPAVMQARRDALERRIAMRLGAEPWRDPASDSYDPLRVIKHQRGWLRAAPVLCGLLLTACATPAPQVITRPVYIDRVKVVVQPIPESLLREHPIAEGPPSQCLEVAAQRRQEVAACNADKAALRQLQGTEGQGDE